MEFLKKNYGLLICIIVCLGAIVWLTMMCMGQRKLCDEYEGEIKMCRDFFNKINSNGLNLNPDDETGELENLIISEGNLDRVETQYKNLLTECITRYRISPEARTLPLNNPALAKEMIEKQLSILNAQIKANKLMIGTRGEGAGGGAAGSSIAPEIPRLFADGRQISNDDVKNAFRQMEIYRRLLALLVEAGITEVPTLELPCVFSTIARDGYTITPLHLTVRGESQQLQNFFNSLTFCDNTYFNIKSLGIELLNITTPVNIFSPYFFARYNARNAKLLGDSGKAMGGTNIKMGLLRAYNAVGPALGGNVSAAGTGSTVSYSSDSDGPSLGTGTRSSGSGRISDNDPDAWVVEEIKRQDYLVFKQNRQFRMDLNADIIEFVMVEDDVEEEE